MIDWSAKSTTFTPHGKKWRHKIYSWFQTWLIKIYFIDFKWFLQNCVNFISIYWNLHFMISHEPGYLSEAIKVDRRKRQYRWQRNTNIQITFQKIEIYRKLTFKSSVISQKDESQNGCFKKTKHAKFSLKHPFWDSPFFLITDDIF